MSKINHMGHFTAIGMRTHVEDANALIINTCSGNDTADAGDATRWTWANPTNRALIHRFMDVEAVSVECLWQGTKVFTEDGGPDPRTLAGEWRRGKAKKPVGAYGGPGVLLRTAGAARRTIYLPAFQRQIDHWLTNPNVARWVLEAQAHDGPVYLRDHDIGRGVDRGGPMSHAWVLATYLNTDCMPT